MSQAKGERRGIVKTPEESQSADFGKGEQVIVLRPGYRGCAGHVHGKTKDGTRILVNIEGGFRIAVLPTELKRFISE
jgi:hypothetical protein